MLLLTTNKKPRYIIHGVPKDTLIIYLCYGSATSTNICIYYSAVIDIIRQNMTSEVDPHAVRVKGFV